MKVTLIDYTGAGTPDPARHAANVLVFTKRTRLEMDPYWVLRYRGDASNSDILNGARIYGEDHTELLGIRQLHVPGQQCHTRLYPSVCTLQDRFLRTANNAGAGRAGLGCPGWPNRFRTTLTGSRSISMPCRAD